MTGMKIFHVWLLPVAWCLCEVFAFQNPGDEYGLWAMGSGAGIWILFIVGNVGDIKGALVPVTVAGVLTMVPVGFLMDRIRVNRRLWAIAWLLLAGAVGVVSVFSHPSYERAIAKNGSLAAYVPYSCNIGLYLSALLSIVVTVGRRVVRPRQTAG
jgi:hypothetical protein